MRAGSVGLLMLLFAAPVAAQNTFDLSVQNIMRGPELVGVPPSNIHWTDDSRWVYFEWKPGGLEWDAPESLYRVRSDGTGLERIEAGAADSLRVFLADGPISPDARWRAVEHGGDLHLIDRRTLQLRTLTDTRDRETSPAFSADGTLLYFLRNNNIFALHLARGSVRQLTDVREQPAPEEKVATGQRGFLEAQQRELFEHIRRERAREEREKALREAREARELKPIYLQKDERVRGLTIEPRGAYAIITAGKPGNDARNTIIPDWVTKTGYTEPLEMRSKVGDAQTEIGRLGVVSLATGTVSWIALPPATGDTATTFFATRFLGWNDAGTHGLISAFSADFKQQWLWTMDAATGALTTVAHDRDDAWIQGPCAFWSGCAGWLPNGDVFFASERTGHSQLYAVSRNGGEPRALTRGSWEVQNVQLAPDKSRFYITANATGPHTVHFYHLPIDGGELRAITTADGRQDATPSPDGRRVAIVHSTADTPPELYLADHRAGATMQRVTQSPTEEWRSYEWITPEIVQVPARDGTPVPARIYRPQDVGAQPNGAAVIFVHGAGYLQNVHNWWSSYYREYMFHHLLAERGYVVLDMDYRGSAGYGRDWRTAIYRHMGGTDLTDQIDGSRWLQATYGIDAERVGIYGGSYGGFITLMALFTAADEFGAGAALRSVTDWAHYNHIYTGRILNLPHTDTLAYRQSSPIYFAEGLEDPLLIAHGMVDVNVHFSDVVRLAQRLIELGKEDWEMAVYPVEDHGFVEPSSWTDEYRRILKLFEEELHSP